MYRDLKYGLAHESTQQSLNALSNIAPPESDEMVTPTVFDYSLLNTTGRDSPVMMTFEEMRMYNGCDSPVMITSKEMCLYNSSNSPRLLTREELDSSFRIMQST